MKPHPRIRKTIKWGGAAVTVLLVVVWVGSYWRGILGYGERHSSFTVMARGAAFRQWHEHRPADDQVNMVAGLGLFSPEDLPQWPSFTWPSISISSMGAEGTLVIPFWLPVLAVLAPTALAWRLDILARRRARVGFCPKCHYDRAGLRGGAVCPECGAMPVSV